MYHELCYLLTIISGGGGRNASIHTGKSDAIWRRREQGLFLIYILLFTPTGNQTWPRKHQHPASWPQAWPCLFLFCSCKGRALARFNFFSTELLSAVAGRDLWNPSRFQADGEPKICRCKASLGGRQPSTLEGKTNPSCAFKI